MAEADSDDGESDDSIDYLSHLRDTRSATFIIGEECLAKWSGDKKLYEAKIKEFNKTSTATLALVTYDGFDSDQDEWHDITRLQKKQHLQESNTQESNVIVVEDKKLDNLPAPLFSPLKGDEEEQRIKNKYKYLDDDDDYYLNTGKASSEQKRWPTISRCIISDTNHKSASSGRWKNKTATLKTKRKIKYPKDEVSTRANDQDELLSISSPITDDNSIHSGFSNEDLEKPYFPKIKPDEKVPLILSEPREKPEVKVPATINRYLRDYQREGVRFLYQHYSSGHGALLADDMGLGKTVQVIALIAALLGKTGTKSDIIAQKPYFIRKMMGDKLVDEGRRCKPFLIVGPASVLYNWVDELETWGYFTVSKYHKNFKSQAITDLKNQKVDVVVTSYETFRDNVDELNHFQWEAVFADEVHKIKGLKTEVTKALRSISCLRRFGLSGTPLQNNIQELWSLLDWCNPGCLGHLKEFTHKYCDVIEAGQNHNATKRQLAEARRAQAKLAVIRGKWVLRRTKSLIQDELPQKSEMVVYCKPTPIQVSVYKAILNLEWMDYVLKQREPCPCGSNKKRMFCCYQRLPLPPPHNKSVRSLTMSYMHLLLKAANHIALLLPSNTNSENQKKEAEKICEKVFLEHRDFVNQTKEAAFKTLSNPKYSGKMKVLQGLLSVFRKQQSKVLIFSYSTQLLDILEMYIMTRGYEYYRLDGSTNQSTRVKLVREFNLKPDIFIFLISTKAGGVGLNLTGANVVIIFDPNWNPAHDLQAQDRAYRIGQRRDVRVYRLITSGTIEENIYLRQVHKQQLGDVAMSTKNTKRLFCDNELFGIESTFHFRSGDRCLTEDILKRHSKVEEGLRCNVVSDLKDVHIEECRLFPGDDDDDNKLLAPTSTVPNENEQYIESSDSETDSFGLSYVCTQLLDFNEEDTGESIEASDNNKVASKRKYKNVDDSDKHKTLQKCKQQTECDDDKSVDSFLDELLGLPTSPTTSKKHKSSTEVKDAHKNEERKCKSGDSKQTATDIFDDSESEDILGDLWQEMESLNQGGSVVKARCQGTIPIQSNTQKNVVFLDCLHSSDKLTNTKFTTSHRQSVQKSKIRSDKIRNKQKQVCMSHKRSGLHSGKQMNSQRLFERVSEVTRTKHRTKTSTACLDGNDKGSTSRDVRELTFAKTFGNTFESITDVFAECGVIHMHQNQKMTATSKAEDYMSRRAINDVFENYCNTQEPAIICKPTMKKQIKPKARKSPKLQISDSTKCNSSKKTPKPKQELGFFYGPRSLISGGKKILIGQTPKAIKRQHFLKLARYIQKKSDTEDAVKFAKQVLRSKRREHIHWLEMYYRNDLGLKDIIPKQKDNT